MITALFVRSDSFYKCLHRVDAWDQERDARRWPGAGPALARRWPGAGPALARRWPGDTVVSIDGSAVTFIQIR